MRTRTISAGRQELGLGVGIAIAAVLAAIDISDDGPNLVTTVILAPLVTAAIAGSRATIAVRQPRRCGAAGFATAEALLNTPPGELVARFDSFHEDGSPLDMATLPGRRVLAGETPEPAVVRAIERRTGEERWQVVKATAVVDGNCEVRFAVNVIEDVTEVKWAELRQGVLAQAGTILASSLDYERTLQSVAELAVPDIADWCAVSMPDGRGAIRQVSVAHTDGAKIALARELGERYPTSADEETGVAAVIRSGQTDLLNKIPAEALELGAQDAEHLELLRGLGLRAADVRVRRSRIRASTRSGRTSPGPCRPACCRPAYRRSRGGAPRASTNRRGGRSGRRRLLRRHLARRRRARRDRRRGR